MMGPALRYWVKGAAYNRVTSQWFPWTALQTFVTASPPKLQLNSIHPDCLSLRLQPQVGWLWKQRVRPFLGFSDSDTFPNFMHCDQTPRLFLTTPHH